VNFPSTQILLASNFPLPRKSRSKSISRTLTDATVWNCCGHRTEGEALGVESPEGRVER
jgi:hypothetical protein